MLELFLVSVVSLAIVLCLQAHRAARQTRFHREGARGQTNGSEDTRTGAVRSPNALVWRP